MVKENDYESLYHQEMVERSDFKYPPYHRLINIYLKSKDGRVVQSAAMCMAQGMKKVFGDRVLGPDRPLVARIQTFYLMKIMLKIEVTASFEKAKQLLKELEVELLAQPQYKGVMINVDVDPM
jgi:primosomal protein N' (replication factor Y)